MKSVQVNRLLVGILFYAFFLIFFGQRVFAANTSSVDNTFQYILEQMRNEADTESLEELLQDIELEENQESQVQEGKQPPIPVAVPQSFPVKPVLESKKKQLEYPLQKCRDDALGIKLVCDPEWGLEENLDTIMLIVSENPAVTCTITKKKANIRFLGQMTKDTIRDMGNYQDGFQTEYVDFADQMALQVKAFSREFPDMRHNDYYLLHDEYIYGILFAVYPQSGWDNYKFVLKRISDSFRFIDSNKEETTTVTSR